MTATIRQTKSARPSAPGRACGPAPDRASGRTTRLAKPNAFPKSARLLKHASFQDVYDRGRKHFSANMIFFYLLKPAEDNKVSVHIGLTVGRALGGAVIRNRIKRRMRDVVRHNFAALRDALHARGISAEIVINPKKAALAADIAALRTEVERGFSLIAQASGAANTPSGDARAR
jgi:ribonuclease P protein component